jgi:hypothetical protein
MPALLPFQHHYAVEEMQHETFEEVGQRVIEGVQKIGQKAIRANHDEVLLVSHGDPIQALRLWGAKMDVTTLNRDIANHTNGNEGVPYPTYGSLTTIEMGYNGMVRNIEINDTFERDPNEPPPNLPMYWLTSQQKAQASSNLGPVGMIQPH